MEEARGRKEPLGVPGSDFGCWPRKCPGLGAAAEGLDWPTQKNAGCKRPSFTCGKPMVYRWPKVFDPLRDATLIDPKCKPLRSAESISVWPQRTSGQPLSDGESGIRWYFYNTADTIGTRRSEGWLDRLGGRSSYLLIVTHCTQPPMGWLVRASPRALSSTRQQETLSAIPG